MDISMIKYKLMSLGYTLLIPHGPESFQDGTNRWIYTAYVEKNDSLEIVEDGDYILINSEDGDDAIEEFIYNNALIYLHQENILAVSLNGKLVEKSSLLIFKL